MMRISRYERLKDESQFQYITTNWSQQICRQRENKDRKENVDILFPNTAPRTQGERLSSFLVVRVKFFVDPSFGDESVCISEVLLVVGGCP